MARLTNATKNELADAAANRAYESTIAARNKALIGVADRIYDHVIAYFGLTEVIRTTNPEALDKIGTFRIQFQPDRFYTMVEFSNVKLWTGGSYYFELERVRTLSLTELGDEYLEKQAHRDEASAARNALRLDLLSALESINTIKQLQERMPPLYELYVQRGGLDDTKNLPVAVYTQLNQRLDMLLNKAA
jgi:hypothetical protein